MDFFGQQARSRRATFWLVALFGCSVLLTTLLIYLGVDLACMSTEGSFRGDYEDLYRPYALPLTAAVVFSIIGIGSAIKQRQLAGPGGGIFLAEMMGANPIQTASPNPNEMTFINIVEEMAIASGTPIPSLYLLEAGSINAFVAGSTPQDSVLVVTRGAITKLSREELQGVIAHEFSHLLNGDSRLNMKLLTILHGLVAVSLVGRLLFELVARSRNSSKSSSKKKDGNGFAALLGAIGLVFWLVGWVGVFFAGLIQRAISRQREFLADASAVQFTRNPDGIAGALQKIAAGAGAEVPGPQVKDMAHFFFADGVKRRIAGLMATHPPVPVRLARIGSLRFPVVPAEREGHANPALPPSSPALGFAVTPTPSGIVSGVGETSRAGLADAATLLAFLPEDLGRAARDPFEVRGLLLAFLLDAEATTRAAQLARVAAAVNPFLVSGIETFARPVSLLPRRLRLPLVALTRPTVSQLSRTQSQELLAGMDALIEADRRIDLFEYGVRRLITKSHPTRRMARPTGGDYTPAMVTALSTLALQAGGEEAIAKAFATGTATLADLLPVASPSPASGYEDLSNALDALAVAPPELRRRVLEAGVACILADRIITDKEAELIYLLGDSLDCPIPRLLGTSAER